MMRLARAGIGVAVAGGIALAVHGHLLAKEAQRSDCAAWEASVAAVAAQEDTNSWWKWESREDDRELVSSALADPHPRLLWLAHLRLVARPQLLWLLLPALRDPTYVGFPTAGDVDLDGSEDPLLRHAKFVLDDLSTRAGRASWLLKQATGHRAAIVRARTDPRQLAKLSDDWQRWLDSLDGGKACSGVP